MAAYRPDLLALVLGSLLLFSYANGKVGEEEQEEFEDNDVLVLTEANFNEVVNKENLILVEFYAPWCGHCKKLAPEYAMAATELKLDNIPLAKVDATEESALAQEYQVKGYPTLFVFRRGVKFEYKGPREAQGMVKYMREQASPAAKELHNLKQVKNFMKSEESTVVGFFEENDNTSDLFQIFISAADELRDDVIKFSYIRDPEAANSFGISLPNVVTALSPKYKSKFENQIRVLEESVKAGVDLIDWIKRSAAPLLGQRNVKNGKFLYMDRYPILVLYMSVNNDPEGFNYWMQRFLPTASTYKKEGIYFAISDDEEFQHELQQIGLGEWAEDIAAALWEGPRIRYPLFEEVTVDSLATFLDDYLDGNLKPYLKSQKPPNKQKGPVTVVVGKTLQEIVFDRNKDVLLEIYAPWCGHCKALEPKYKKLAEKFKDNENLVIAKIDGTANDLPPTMAYDGFPTVFFVPAGSDAKPEKYSGEREVKAFVKFLKEKAVHALGSKTKEEL